MPNENQTLAITCLLTLLFSLINIPLLGAETLFPLIGMSFCIFLSATICLLFSISKSNPKASYISKSTLCLFVFISYIAISTFKHEQASVNLLFWLSIFIFWVTLNYTTVEKPLPESIFTIISWLAIIESMIVILQFVKIVPSKNELFPCTGTWVNPNVTSMFLAMALIAICKKLKSKRTYTFIFIGVTITGILLLKCRTAYIVTTYIVISEIVTRLQQKKMRTLKVVGISCVILIFFLAGSMWVSQKKQPSTSGRVLIFQNSIRLIKESPFLGGGFGMFEKKYNQYVADKNMPSQGFVRMAYNDYLELLVEGGIVATLLWLIFIIFCIRSALLNKSSIVPIISFIIIQLTNFGFQSLPAFLLFILYTSYEHKYKIQRKNFTKISGPFLGYSTILIFLISLYGLYQSVFYAKGFYQIKNRMMYGTGLITQEDNSKLKELIIYNLLKGDESFKNAQYKAASTYYNKALQRTCNPTLIVKAGNAYLMQDRYDSAIYQYRRACIIEPKKLLFKKILLTAFQSRNDTSEAKQIAKQILSTPIVGNLKSGKEIHAYASLYLTQLSNTK